MNEIVAILYHYGCRDYVIKYRNIFTGECCHRLKKRLGVREKIFMKYIAYAREEDVNGIYWFREDEYFGC